MNKQRRYYAYMLRLWETANGERRVWRASLETPGSKQRQGFASLESLMAFLEAETGDRDAQDGEAEIGDGETGRRPTGF